MEYKVSGSKRNKKFVEAIMPSIITQLGLDNSRKAVIVQIEVQEVLKSPYTTIGALSYISNSSELSKGLQSLIFVKLNQ